jgi:hypothetical protein
MKKSPLANLTQNLRAILSRNWKAKLVALMLAFLFWYSVKTEIGGQDTRHLRLEETLQQHSLGGATKL